MTWIVLGEQNGRIRLISKSTVTGLLPKGSYLTIEDGETKHILRVDESSQIEPYSPSPLIAELDLGSVAQDMKTQNQILAYRVKDLTRRTDGLIDFIKPQLTGRRSNREEVVTAISANNTGPKVFLATIYANNNQILCDEVGAPIAISLPEDMFFHQIMIVGRTGLGKSVCTKYLSQYFVETLKGAVLAINVKDTDFLRMDQPSTSYDDWKSEWEKLGESPHGIDNFTVYYPAISSIPRERGVDPSKFRRITLSIDELEPEALSGLLRNITDVASQNLPNIFRYWKEEEAPKDKTKKKTSFQDFILYFRKIAEDGSIFKTKNSRGEFADVTLHKGTIGNLLRSFDYARDFFDNADAKTLNAGDVLISGKYSVINVAVEKGVDFGAIVLRDLLHKIVQAKNSGEYDCEILIIIDEVHQFYNNESSKEALDDLDTICRTGRSQKIGVIFSSQTPSDIPRGLSNVINTKLFFNSDITSAKNLGIVIDPEEMSSLSKGYAFCSIYGLPQVKLIKFPVSYAGVFKKD